MGFTVKMILGQINSPCPMILIGVDGANSKKKKKEKEKIALQFENQRKKELLSGSYIIKEETISDRLF